MTSTPSETTARPTGRRQLGRRARMAPECSRRDASPSATLLIVSVALYTVLAAASSPKALASSSSLSSRAALEQQLPLSADLTTVCTRTAISPDLREFTLAYTAKPLRA